MRNRTNLMGGPNEKKRESVKYPTVIINNEQRKNQRIN